MKINKKYLFGVAVVLAAITFGFIACSDPGGGGGATAQELADAFKSDYADALELTVGGVNTNDEAKVKDALEAYESLRADAKALLTDEKALLDSLKEKIDELIAAATAQELATTFKTENADALKLTVGDVNTNDEAKVNEALEAYEALRADAKALLTDEKALLDSLKEEIEKQKVVADANTFKANNADALALTTVSVGASDEATVNKALQAYESLSNAAKALLTTEKALLDSLKEKIIAEITVPITITNAEQWSTAITQIRNGGSGTSLNIKYYALTIGGDFVVVSTTSFGSAAYIKVTLNGKGTISKNSSGDLLYIGSNQTLVIDGEDLILQGLTAGNSATVIYADNGSELELRNGTITGNSAAQLSQGGGVHVLNANFIMSGGKITGNTSSPCGGVYVSSGTFTMSGGDITGNTGNSVYVTGNGTFTMNGGNITGNTGSGVYVYRGAFTMNGGNITGNKTSNGGGVNVAESSNTFIMNGGDITGNTVSTRGGGVYVAGSSSTFTMNGGNISENEANTSSLYGGGGVYVSSATFIMNKGNISKNTATNNGGGVFNDYNGTFTMNDGSISENEATNGGGVYNLSTFTMNDGSISKNTATTSGGGVYITGSSSTFTMNGGSISENEATTSGGGVFNYATFTMNDGSISENESTNGGGVYIYSGSSYKFTMSGGSITSNKSNNQGGGVWIGASGVFTKANSSTGTSGVINSNTATIANGQQVFWNSSTNRYRNAALNEADELSTTNTSVGWGQ